MGNIFFFQLPYDTFKRDDPVTVKLLKSTSKKVHEASATFK